MSFIIKPRRFNLQPGYFARLNPEWVKRGLTHVIDPGRLIYTTVAGTFPLIQGNTPGKVASKPGRVAGFGSTDAGNTNSNLTGPVIPVPKTGFRSLFVRVYARTTGGGTIGRVFQDTTGSGVTSGAEGLWMVSSRLAYNALNSGPSDTLQCAPTAALTLNAWVTQSLTHDRNAAFGTLPIFYVNGVEVAASVIASAGSAYSTLHTTLSIGNRVSDFARTWDGMIGALVFFDGYLSPADHAALNASPWSVYEAPASRIWIPGAASAGTQTLTPTLYTNSQTFYSPTVTAGAVALAAGLFTNAQTFYAPTVAPGAVAMTAGLFTNSNTFYGHTLTTNYGLVASLFTNSPSFYAPTVSAGSVTLAPTLFSNAATFYAPTVSQGAAPQALTPTLVTNSNTFFGHALTTSTTLTVGLFTNSNSFFGHTLTTNYGLVAALFTNSPTFYVPTISVGQVTLSPTLFSNAATFYTPVVTISGGPQYLVPDLYSSSQTFYSPSVVPGSVTLTATRLDNDQTFYTHVVSQGGGPQTLTPGLYSNSQTFFAPTITVGAVTITPALYSNANTFYAPTVSGGTTPALTLTPDDIAAIVAAVWASPLAPTPSSIAAAVWDEIL